ncbi:YbaB/EbfC family nucleoid-associated protein [Nocardia halotolerans]|uniref:YbaB/EbfC family nucleoid-associated protein n=1 Tax=Nocardia halotolerans TaxID=1755878 RepID=A0ABV8VDB6_9NOCA
MSAADTPTPDDLYTWAADLERTAQRFTDLKTQMDAVSVTDTSADGKISVTVDANGSPTSITLAPSTRGADPATIAAELMACIHRGQAKLRDRITGLVTDSVGDTGPGHNIIDQYAERFPDPEPTPPAPAEPAFVPTEPQVPQHQQPPAVLPHSRTPDRNAIYEPDEPDDEDRFYQGKSWLV